LKLKLTLFTLLKEIIVIIIVIKNKENKI